MDQEFRKFLLEATAEETIDRIPRSYVSTKDNFESNPTWRKLLDTLEQATESGYQDLGRVFSMTPEMVKCKKSQDAIIFNISEVIPDLHDEVVFCPSAKKFYYFAKTRNLI